MEPCPANIRILAVVEATTVNAVAKNMLEFYRAAGELRQADAAVPCIELTVATFDRDIDGRSSSEFSTVARDLGLEVDVIRERFRFDTRALSALREIIDRSNPDIILTHQVKSHLLMKLSRLWKKYPWVAFHHGYTTTDRKMRAYNLLNRWSLPSADRVITVCQAFARDLTTAGVRQECIHVEHNAIRPRTLDNSRQGKEVRTRFQIEDDALVVLSVGRLSNEKGHIDLIAAFSKLTHENPELDATLMIVGDGPERNNLTTAVSRLQLDGKVILVGEVNDVQPYYDSANIAVLPSHSEGSPYVLLEAIDAGLPVVATAVGGVPEMVTDEETALLVPAHNPKAISNAIYRLLSDPQLARKLTTHASNLLATRYRPEIQTRSLVAFYQTVLSSNARAWRN